MKALINQLEAFWTAPISPYPIAAFRILFGVYLLLYFLGFMHQVPLVFSSEGVYAPFLLPDYAPPVAVAWVVYSLTVATILAFTVGFKTRWVTPLLLTLYLYHYFLHIASSGTSYDRLIIIFLMVLCFAQADGVWSLEQSLNKQPVTTVSAWPTRILTLQVAFLYLGAGLYKAFASHWHNGQIMEWTLIGPWATPLGFWFANIHWPQWFYTCLTYSIVLLECLGGIGFYLRAVQRYFFALGFLFHFCIWLMLNIPQFMICPCSYVLFMNEADIRRLAGFFQRNKAEVKNLKEYASIQSGES